MDYEQKQREAFYLIKKYSSLTWYAEIHRLWKQFCEHYERDFYRHPVVAPPTSSLAGTRYTPGPWDEQNLKMFWGYAGDMEEGLNLIRQGNKPHGHQYFSSGSSTTWLFSRRFEEIDLSDFGYRRSKDLGVSEGIFADAERAYDMAIADCIRSHIDELRHDFQALSYKHMLAYFESNARALQIPFGVPPGELPPLPALDPNAPSVMTGEEVPAMGIWVVEPDAAHVGQTYCMAYMRPWAPAIDTVSEQEYETNTRWTRTRDEAYRKNSDNIKDYPVRWRLLWRDERDYNDGKVPAEEADYLIYREPGSTAALASDPLRLRCDGGQPCPREGWWFTPAKADSRQHFQQGDVMSRLGGDYGETIWQWDAQQA
jgi:Immunity protein 72